MVSGTRSAGRVLVGGFFAMSEIANFGTIVLIVSAGFGLALLSSKLTERLPIPPPAVFLIAAAAVSDIGRVCTTTRRFTRSSGSPWSR